MIDQKMVSDIQITRVAARFGVNPSEFLDRYRGGERYCEEHKGWVGRLDIILDPTQPFGHRWCCVHCVANHSLPCPECDGPAKVINRIKRGFDIKLTKQCLDCDYEFDTAVSVKTGKENLIHAGKVDKKRKTRLDFKLEAELAYEMGWNRLDEACREQFKEWLLCNWNG